jgi:hypothetical protein
MLLEGPCVWKQFFWNLTHLALYEKLLISVLDNIIHHILHYSLNYHICQLGINEYCQSLVHLLGRELATIAGRCLNLDWRFMVPSVHRKTNTLLHGSTPIWDTPLYFLAALTYSSVLGRFDYGFNKNVRLLWFPYKKLRNFSVSEISLLRYPQYLRI